MLLQYTSISCDRCGRLICSETSKKTEAERKARHAGWYKNKKGQHYCPKHKGEQS